MKLSTEANEQQTLTLPWIVLDTGELLVSSPSGSILEYSVSPNSAEAISLLFRSDELWNAFFEALIKNGQIPSDVGAD